MKSVMLALALVGCFSLNVRADIPTPPANEEVTQLKVDGADAASLYSTLNVKAQPEDMLRTQTSSVKVWYAVSGTSQIVCKALTRTLPASATVYSCLLEKSKNGKKIQKYTPIRRVG